MPARTARAMAPTLAGERPLTVCKRSLLRALILPLSAHCLACSRAVACGCRSIPLGSPPRLPPRSTTQTAASSQHSSSPRARPRLASMSAPALKTQMGWFVCACVVRESKCRCRFDSVTCFLSGCLWLPTVRPTRILEAASKCQCDTRTCSQRWITTRRRRLTGRGERVQECGSECRCGQRCRSRGATTSFEDRSLRFPVKVGPPPLGFRFSDSFSTLLLQIVTQSVAVHHACVCVGCCSRRLHA